jgi:hypothetical protein
MNAAIAERRLKNQRLTQGFLRQPADVVAWFGAMQAQEYEAAKWALGLRMREGTVDADIERAFAEGQILRTHVMRPTWHFVTPSDIRWLLDLTGRRVQRAMTSYQRKLGLDAATFARGLRVIERALGDGRHLTRQELGECLRREGAPMTSHQLGHMALHVELEGVVCSGPRRGKQFTYALLAERAPNAPRLSRDEALVRLGRCFFRSHGPATLRDFSWWSGLNITDGKRVVDMLKATRHDVDGKTYWSVGNAPRGATANHDAHLLPIYDEYLIAYRDRDAVPHGPSLVASRSAPVTFQHALVIAGQVAGTWRTAGQPQGTRIQPIPLRRLTAAERHAVEAAVGRYERFKGRDRGPRTGNGSAKHRVKP